VILEAMSCGLPVIASRIGGLPELVIDGVNGLLFEPGNASELADRIRLLWRDPELCQRMGRAGRQMAIREHSESVYWDGLRAVYELAKTLSTSGQAAGGGSACGV
jgi:glycosyltransferase involved in cell wall biosynthesis